MRSLSVVLRLYVTVFGEMSDEPAARPGEALRTAMAARRRLLMSDFTGEWAYQCDVAVKNTWLRENSAKPTFEKLR